MTDRQAAIDAFARHLASERRLSPHTVKHYRRDLRTAAEVLRPVWELSDVDKDGMLDDQEYALACYLCWMAGEGQPLPAKLPPELVPPVKGANPF